MYPLDFEEFFWANGISENIIDEIRKHFNEETPVPDGLHVPLNDLFRKYAVVGGMPEAVNTFLETNNISDVYEVQQNIIEEYKDDMVKYAADSSLRRPIILGKEALTRTRTASPGCTSPKAQTSTCIQKKTSQK